MKIEDLMTPREVADILGETVHNIYKTYRERKPKKYKILIIGALFLREKVTVTELKEALLYIKARREIKSRT